MEFFWSTDAGAIDFAIFCAAIALGCIFGSRGVKLLCAVAVAVFLLDRTTMAMFDGVTFALVNMGMTLCAVVAILNFDIGKLANGYIGLFAVKLAALTAMIAGAINFETMAATATLSVYGQLFLLFGGAADGPHGGRLGRLYHFSVDSPGGGRSFLLGLLVGGGAPSGLVFMSRHSLEANQNPTEENRGA